MSAVGTLGPAGPWGLWDPGGLRGPGACGALGAVGPWGLWDPGASPAAVRWAAAVGVARLHGGGAGGVR